MTALFNRLLDWWVVTWLAVRLWGVLGYGLLFAAFYSPPVGDDWLSRFTRAVNVCLAVYLILVDHRRRPNTRVQPPASRGPTA